MMVRTTKQIVEYYQHNFEKPKLDPEKWVCLADLKKQIVAMQQNEINHKLTLFRVLKLLESDNND